MPIDIWRQSGFELVSGYQAGQCSPVEVVEAVLARIEKINPLINAITTLDVEGALTAARASERRWHNGTALGPLDGVPITVKDNILVKDLRATWGSRVYETFTPMVDELPIARLRSAGTVILGKTNCPEFTLQGYTDNLLFGPTRNPWNLELTPGGSSGGGVSAVSAGLGPVAIGTDGGGSIRRPASHTGLVGLKPSRGRVPRCDGFPAILLDFEAVGVIARTVVDVVSVMRAISDYDPRDPVASDISRHPFEVPAAPRCRIAFVPKFGESPVDPEIVRQVENAARALEGLGHTLEKGDAPFDFERVSEAWPVFSQVGLAWLVKQHPEWNGKINNTLDEMAVAGARRTATDYYDALEIVKELRSDLALFFESYDVIMTPSAAALPWPASEAFPPIIAGEQVGPRGHAVFTAFANMAGCPGINLPANPAENGLPIGFQLVGAPGKDGLLCAIGAQYESTYPWVGRFPKI